MNLPNRLSILRVLCIPLIVLFLYLDPAWCHWTAVGLFLLASFTDFLDGYIARKHQLITDFGKFIDPVADKLLVLSTLIMLVHMQLVPAWMIILILSRELSVDGLRLVAATKGKVIPAGWSGKVKTFSQMILILYLLLIQIHVFSHWTGLILSIWVIAVTLYSGVDYFMKNHAVFS